MAAAGGDRWLAPNRPDRRRGGVEPQASHHQVPAAGRADAQDSGAADPLRPSLRLDGQRTIDWGEVAADAGYADQAHLIRDFASSPGLLRPTS
jgi:hypothetical protein